MAGRTAPLAVSVPLAAAGVASPAAAVDGVLRFVVRAALSLAAAAVAFVPPAALAPSMARPAAVSNAQPPHPATGPALAEWPGGAHLARRAGCAPPSGDVRKPPANNWVRLRYPAERIAAQSSGVRVTVAVIDSGVDAKHPLLAGRVTDGADYLDRSGDGTLDCVGHGTAVASIIAGAASADGAVRGLAPKATILPVRVSEQQGEAGARTGRTASPARFGGAIRWAVDHGARVLNLSVVLTEDYGQVRDAIAYAVDKDAVVVAAAGNRADSGSPRPYPAAYPGVLGVGAIAADGVRAPFSQVGSYVDVVAPGSEVPAAAPAGSTGSFSGTSYATPFVSAAAALVLSAHPGYRADQVIRRLLATADPAPGAAEAGYGAGIVNPYRALTETVTNATPRTMAPLPAPAADPLKAVADQQARHLRDRAARFAGWAVGATVVVLLLGAVVPHGARRRWRAPQRR